MQKITALPKLQPRPANGHKGMFGRVLVAGGAWGMTGAAAMTALSALRSGAGLVKVACPEPVLPIVASISPVYTTMPLAADETGALAKTAVHDLLDEAAKNDVTAFGPGTGTARGVRDCLAALLRENVRLVIDADGLNCLAKMSADLEHFKASAILTPHPGEMKRLWSGFIRRDEPADRVEQAAELARLTGTTVVLKGAGTVVSDGEKYYVNQTGNPGMSTGGTGDILTGTIAALMGQGLSNFDAAVLGVHTHGLAGDLAADQKGQISLIATDLIESLPAAFKQTTTTD